MPAMTQANRSRLQARLRTMLRSPELVIDPAETQGGTPQLRVGSDVLGTVDQVDEDGEVFWAVTLIVLAEDLAP